MNNLTSDPATTSITSRNQPVAASASNGTSADPNDNDANHNREHASNTKSLRRMTMRQRNTQEPADATSPSSSDESTSSEGTSSEGEDSDSDEDANVNGSDEDRSAPQIAGRQKPRIHRVEKGSDILSRVSAFLPQMKDANESLEREIAAGRGKDLRLDDVDDEEHEGRYIEMNLGLGVLEEKRSGDDDSATSDQKDDMSESEDQIPASSKQQRDSNVMGKLMGNEQSTSKKPTIEEMNQ